MIVGRFRGKMSKHSLELIYKQRKMVLWEEGHYCVNILSEKLI